MLLATCEYAKKKKNKFYILGTWIGKVLHRAMEITPESLFLLRRCIIATWKTNITKWCKTRLSESTSSHSRTVLLDCEIRGLWRKGRLQGGGVIIEFWGFHKSPPWAQQPRLCSGASRDWLLPIIPAHKARLLFKILAPYIKEIEFRLNLWCRGALARLFFFSFFFNKVTVLWGSLWVCYGVCAACLCYERRKVENLIIPVIKAIIRGGEKKKKEKKKKRNSDPKMSQLESITAQSAATY